MESVGNASFVRSRWGAWAGLSRGTLRKRAGAAHVLARASPLTGASAPPPPARGQRALAHHAHRWQFPSLHSFTNCSAKLGGGAIYAFRADYEVVISGSSFVGCSASEGPGGAVYLMTVGQVTFVGDLVRCAARAHAAVHGASTQQLNGAGEWRPG